MENKRLVYAFAHAGGSSMLYRQWKDRLKNCDSVELVAVDLPGRGTMAQQPAITDLTRLAKILADHIHADLVQRGREACRNWITFGHSFGGVLSFAVAKSMEQLHGRCPLFSIVSGSLAPAIQEKDNLHTLSDEAILARLKSDNGTPAQILEEPVLARRVVSHMRNDYEVRRQFTQMQHHKASHPLLTLCGKDDQFVTPEMMGAWKNHTASLIRQWEIPGGHFSVYNYLDLIMPLFLFGSEQKPMLTVS